MNPMDRAMLERAVERVPFAGHEGKSGAALERVQLADGTRVVVKRFAPDDDIVMRLTGDRRGREVAMWQSGFFERLPSEVGHAVVGGWFEDDHGVLVMRDLGGSVLTWQDRLAVAEVRGVLRSVVALHRAFQGAPPDGLAALDAVIGPFEPRRIRPYVGVALADSVLRGWAYFADLAPDAVGRMVLALATETTPLTSALSALPATVVHGDLATVNMALERDRLTLIDWGMATAAPGAVDIGRLLAGCAHVFDVSPDDFLELYREAAADLYDQRATELGLLTGIVWLGWNKALDIVEHPDEAVRGRERAGLAWWLARAGEALDGGL
jgi:Phosphotransferase enzyme family